MIQQNLRKLITKCQSFGERKGHVKLAKSAFGTLSVGVEKRVLYNLLEFLMSKFPRNSDTIKKKS